ncbi:helix-turn-helix transcriptional regulator [Vibrio cyclitrophicus]|uniref:helix-turn-helix transcriptional regulator n=1 Tax=Vibrio cyclitrophicus TaxID=47951 RepID=UPI000C845B9E|nr:helix-turn-helix domain-containing protein [Vibrio cyclitrophicus]PMG85257.1 hypothetical protein BCU82_16145 [Vibrio cyclitrophicus]PMH55105.1 hypothetical protein BCU65_16910 [Vibrio cyclitrophicus]PMH74233.1 hypothetical protein BCU59_21375 [Vibrio cyclitrophicus]
MAVKGNSEIKQEFFRMDDIAKMLGVSVATVKHWRANRNFPKPLKISTRVALFRITDVNDWLEAQHDNFEKA